MIFLTKTNQLQIKIIEQENFKKKINSHTVLTNHLKEFFGAKQTHVTAQLLNNLE